MEKKIRTSFAKMRRGIFYSFDDLKPNECKQCALEHMTINEIINSKRDKNTVSVHSPDYCLCLARDMIDAQMNGTSFPGEHEPIQLTQCFQRKILKKYVDRRKFSIGNGRHRICICTKLRKKGITIDYPIYVTIADRGIVNSSKRNKWIKL